MRLLILLLAVSPVFASVEATVATTAVIEPIQRALALIETGDMSAVREQLIEAAAVPGPRPAVVSAALGKGLMACGAWAEAVQALEDAKVTGEAIPDLDYRLGVAYFHVKRDADCVAALSGELDSDEAKAGARYYLGLALARLGRTAEARAQLLRKPERKPVESERETRDINAFLYE